MLPSDSAALSMLDSLTVGLSQSWPSLSAGPLSVLALSQSATLSVLAYRSASLSMCWPLGAGLAQCPALSVLALSQCRPCLNAGPLSLLDSLSVGLSQSSTLTVLASLSAAHS